MFEKETIKSNILRHMHLLYNCNFTFSQNGSLRSCFPSKYLHEICCVNSPQQVGAKSTKIRPWMLSSSFSLSALMSVAVT